MRSINYNYNETDKFYNMYSIDTFGRFNMNYFSEERALLPREYSCKRNATLILDI